jgi:hypothetical protein
MNRSAASVCICACLCVCIREVEKYRRHVEVLKKEVDDEARIPKRYGPSSLIPFEVYIHCPQRAMSMAQIQKSTSIEHPRIMRHAASQANNYPPPSPPLSICKPCSADRAKLSAKYRAKERSNRYIERAMDVWEAMQRFAGSDPTASASQRPYVALCMFYMCTR